MLELIYTSRKTLTVTPTSYAYFSRWIPWWETMLVKTYYYNAYRLFMDGTLIEFATAGGGIPTELVPMNGPDLYTVRNNPPGYSGYYAMAIDKFTLLADIDHGSLLTTMRLDTCCTNRESWPYLDFGRNQFVVARSGAAAGLYVYDLTTKEQIRYIPLVFGGYIDYGIKLSYVSPSKLAVFESNWQWSQSRGRFAVVDWISGEVVLDTTTTPYWFADFDHVNQVVWAWCPDQKVKVWTLKVIPYSLSNPEWVVPGDVYTLQPRKTKVQLKGDNDEPCKDWWIHWALSMGQGALRWEVSKTDEDGYAYNYYSPPEEPVTEAINAWVVVN